MAERGINIEDIEQRVVSGFFMMDMLVDLKDLKGDLSDLIPGLLEMGKKLGMEARVHLHSERRPPRIAILAGKEPHCLAKLIADHKAGKIRGEIACVFSNHPDLEELATSAGLDFKWKAADDILQHFTWLSEGLRKCEPDAIVLARYMRILPPDLVGSFRHRVINIHPSLLPHFPGAAPYRQAFDSGVRVHGCTAHFVTEQLDQGPVILQDVYHINVGTDTFEDVRENGYELEARTLSRAVQLFLNEELVVVDGKVIFKPGLSQFGGRRLDEVKQENVTK
jgi:formyltetrahydrofolate deformylase